MDKQLTVGSLFSGIGGLDLGLERAGMRVIWQSEIDPYANKVLKKHWPEVPNYGDIKKIDWANVVRPNVICGGYPCQPFSKAGKRRGNDDPRHLWPWVREAISRLRPDYAILENVRGHLSMGGVSVLGDLTGIGYNAEWRLISAASVGAPHLRERIIIVAYPNGSEPSDGGQCKDVPGQNNVGGNDRGRSIRNSGQVGLGGTRHNKNLADSGGKRRLYPQPQILTTEGRIEAQRQSAVGGWWAIEPNICRVANGVPYRVDRLRGLGNAVVPQVAEVVGRLIVEHVKNG